MVSQPITLVNAVYDDTAFSIEVPECNYPLKICYLRHAISYRPSKRPQIINMLAILIVGSYIPSISRFKESWLMAVHRPPEQPFKRAT